MKEELKKILFWLLDEKHNLDSGICDSVTGRPDKDYLIALNKIVDKSADNILAKIPEDIIVEEGKVLLINGSIVLGDFIIGEKAAEDDSYGQGNLVNEIYEKYEGKNIRLKIEIIE